MQYKGRAREKRNEAGPVKPKAWPFYVVYDVSNSMWDEDRHGDQTPWHVMRDSLADLINEVKHSPAAGDICHLGAITFADDTKVLLPLTSLSNPYVIPAMEKGYETNFARIFRTLAAVVQNDFDRLSRAHEVKSPTIYFVTDGHPQVNRRTQPDAEWLAELAKLHGLSCKPVIVAMGLGEAEEKSLCRIRLAPGPACIASLGANQSTLLKTIVNSIIMSVVNSGDRGSFTFDVPAGMRQIVC